jgi:hypothetical protein
MNLCRSVTGVVLLTLALTHVFAGEPVQVVVNHASDPVVAAPVTGKGPVVLVWESGNDQANSIMAQVVDE